MTDTWVPLASMATRDVTYSAKSCFALSRCASTLMAPRMSIIFLSAALACCSGFSEMAVAARAAPTTTTITMAKPNV